MWLIGVIFFIALFSLIIFFSIYNNLIYKKNQVKNVFASLDALLKKRYDLIPNLVAIIKNYTQYEEKLLKEITELRTKAISPNLSNEEKIELDKKFSALFRQINVMVENYPNLKANENFLHLQRTLNEIEEQISAGRRAYNAAVTELNNAIEMFPTNLIASFMGLSHQTLFEIKEEERQNIDINKLFKE